MITVTPSATDTTDTMDAPSTMNGTASAPTWCTFWMAQVRGRVLLDTMASMKARLGAAELGRLTRTLEEPIRELLEGSILASDWYPLGVLTRLLESAVENLYGGDEEILVHRSQAVVEKQLVGAHNSLVRPGCPEFIVRRISVIHAAYFDNVSVSLRMFAGKRATIRYYGFHLEHRLIEPVIRGFYLKALELAGAESPWARFTTPIEAETGYAEIDVGWS